MTKIFVPNTIPTKELGGVIRQIEAAGYDKAQAFVGANFMEFSVPLSRGDIAVVYSLTVFRSITELLAAAEGLAERGVELRSVCEPWFADPRLSPRQLLAELFRLGERLASAPAPPLRRTTLRRNRADLPALAAQVDGLRATQRLSVLQACRTAGCSVSTYYAHKRSDQ